MFDFIPDYVLNALRDEQIKEMSPKEIFLAYIERQGIVGHDYLWELSDRLRYAQETHAFCERHRNDKWASVSLTNLIEDRLNDPKDTLFLHFDDKVKLLLDNDMTLREIEDYLIECQTP